MPSIAPTPPASKYPDLSPLGFWLGMVGVFSLSLVLRFWGLNRFNTLVFDEIYYAKFAAHFLKGELIFTGHPPLSTYIVAIGIWIGNHLPWGDSAVKNGLSGLFLSPFSYRWLNAFTGAFIPMLVGAIAYQLTRRRSFTLLVALLLAADGLFLVESRYALNNVYLITFGLLGNLFFLLALQRQAGWRWLWLSLAGIGFGAAASIKWNGLGFLLGAYLIWIAGWVLWGLGTLRDWARQKWGKSELSEPPSDSSRSLNGVSPLQALTQLHLGHILFCFAVIPALTYYVSWIPYLQLDTENTFWDLQTETFGYHQRVGGVEAHPYCSRWYTWPLMLRPIAYFYETAQASQQPVPAIGPPNPNQVGTVIYDVHAMGNPFLWWLSTAAIVLLILVLAQRLWQWLFSARRHSQPSAVSHLNRYDWLTLYLVINWAANFLPWIKVTRCVFLYHYMESLIFAVMGLALITDRWLYNPLRDRRTMGVIILVIVWLGFIFWLPFFLGLPLSPFDVQIRRWLPSWV